MLDIQTELSNAKLSIDWKGPEHVRRDETYNNNNNNNNNNNIKKNISAEWLNHDGGFVVTLLT